MNIRHELRTPLNHIIGYSEMIMEEANDLALTARHEAVGRIHQRGVALLDLVEKHLGDRSTAPSQINTSLLPGTWRPLIADILHETRILDAGSILDDEDQFRADLKRILSAAEHFRSMVENLDTHRRLNSPRPTQTTGLLRRAESDHTDATQTASTSPLRSARLLVVDDDESNRHMLERRLVRLGYEVQLASNGQQALDQLNQQPVDLILLDLQMPVLGGIETLQRLQADPVLRNIAVLVLSASRDIRRVAECIQLGAEDYLPKPFNPILLQARIGACLEKKRLRDREAAHLRQIEEERHRSDALLHVIFPHDVAAELKSTQRVQPRRSDEVAILFTDIVGFTTWCESRSPVDVHDEIQKLVECFEDLAQQHGLEKIKTIGDSFMAAAGLLQPLPNPALNAVHCGLAMIRAAGELPPRWRIRVGLHVGPVSAGVVGHRKYQYDVWGDTVNTAARLEQAAIPGSICVAEAVWKTLNASCHAKPMGTIQVKGKQPLDLFQITGLL
jgi:class 3 adenylate cyclase